MKAAELRSIVEAGMRHRPIAYAAPVVAMLNALTAHAPALVALLEACEREDGGPFPLPTSVREKMRAVHAIGTPSASAPEPGCTATDCAEHGGTCPRDGPPCDEEQRR